LFQIELNRVKAKFRSKQRDYFSFQYQNFEIVLEYCIIDYSNFLKQLFVVRWWPPQPKSSDIGRAQSTYSLLWTQVNPGKIVLIKKSTCHLFQDMNSFSIILTN